jgi:hypothetical protein
MQKIRQEVETLDIKLQQQKLMQPLQAELTKLVQDRPPDWLDVPQRAPLDSSLLPKLPELLRKPAQDANIEFVDLHSDVKTLSSDGYTRMAFTATVRGSSSGFHRFLISLCQLPYLAELRQVKVSRPKPGGMQMTISAILSLKS